MKPDKHKKKDYFTTSRSDYDDIIRKDTKIHQIKDDDKLDELASRGSNNLCYRSKFTSNALERLLQKHIGDKWDDVYSIIVDKMGHNDGLKWLVDLHAFEQDGKIVSIGYWGTQEVRGFYVLDGILGENKISKWKRDKSKVKATFIDGFVVFKDKDIYYKAPLEKAALSNTIWVYASSANYAREDAWVVFTKANKGKREKFAIPSRYIRQLSSKELMRWELPNTEINENLGLFYY